ncbi:DUF6542 domain-containing protein [Streptomyces canus]|uniref:DUF6542 domain-containing protein n=1 Tax=Streptomyces canus TaxID=58343 RepID=A0AAW8FFT1_9ACTN|nr:DUF6542 domain-containing protein [Streptomyces canus]MDQ0763629.1 hypothetical protein [Streptomyces canus]MDQ0907912.1 hypothetical protein [Streptomyces canus]MDQ1067882.1 hypothetical protein [Streptomyces canus]
MEQHRTRPPHNGTRRPTQGAPLPSQARGERRPPVARRPPPPVVRTLRRLPNPRLTGLGGGLFCTALMFVLGCLVSLLFGSSLTVYGVLFVPVSVLTAVWMRRGDLLTAPIIVPIAFAVGLVPVADSGGGTSGRLMGLFTALATQAGWLYAGTLAAGLIALVRRIRLVRGRSR